ncbi:MAG TPA: MlaD family protein [Thermoanaerobaculia bacterium]|nr:MlaD family protein [Thermoanaerobaculia bacterium]
MSEYDHHEEDRRKKSETPEASVHLARWTPWIWIIPALAIFFVGYLIVRYGFFGGGDITVHFSEAHGLDRYSPVRFRGAKVGTVQKITVSEDGSEVVVRISMDASMNYALRKGTRFWIVEPGLESGGIGSILSGTYVGVAPGPGDEVREFMGQEYAPVLSATQAGKTIILEAHGLGGITIGTPVTFQGMRVGNVLGSEYDATRGVTLIHVFVVQRFAPFIRQSTRFWRGGGLDISLGGGGVKAGGLSLASLLIAPISFYTPEMLAGPEMPQGTHFELYEGEQAAIAAADGPHLAYVTYFTGPVRGVAPGTPVFMKGVQVGSVRDVRLRYLPQTASLETPITLEIDPRKLELPVSGASSRAEVYATMNDALGKLVQKGMRATLSTSLVLPGASGIALETVAPRNSARLAVEHDPPIIPAANQGNGLEGALGAVNDIAARIRNLPIEEIAGHLRSTAERMDSLVHDPVLDQSLQRMNRALADVERVAAVARENAGPIVGSVRNAASSAEHAAKTIDATATQASQSVGPIVESLRNAATSAETAAGRASQLMGTSARQNYDLGELIKEMTRAATAVRSLASYLEENPDSLLKGRK